MRGLLPLTLLALALLGGCGKKEDASNLQQGDYQTSPGPPGGAGAPPATK